MYFTWSWTHFVCFCYPSIWAQVGSFWCIAFTLHCLSSKKYEILESFFWMNKNLSSVARELPYSYNPFLFVDHRHGALFGWLEILVCCINIFHVVLGLVYKIPCQQAWCKLDFHINWWSSQLRMNNFWFSFDLLFSDSAELLLMYYKLFCYFCLFFHWKWDIISSQFYLKWMV